MPEFVNSNFRNNNTLCIWTSCPNAVCDLDVKGVSLGIAFPLFRSVGVLPVALAGTRFCFHHIYGIRDC